MFNESEFDFKHDNGLISKRTLKVKMELCKIRFALVTAELEQQETESIKAGVDPYVMKIFFQDTLQLQLQLELEAAYKKCAAKVAA